MTDSHTTQPLPADPGDILRPALEEAAGQPSATAAAPAAPEVAAPTPAATVQASEAGEPEVSPTMPAAPEAAPEAAPVETAPVEAISIPTAPKAAAPKPKGRGVFAGLGGAARYARTAPSAIMRNPKTAMAAGVALAALIGFGGGRLGSRNDAEAQRWTEAAVALRQSQDEVTRLAGEVRSVRGQVEALRSDRQRTDSPARLAQTSDRLEKTLADHTGRLAKLTEQVERFEKIQRDPARIAGIVERLDRIERQTQTVAERVTTPVPPPKPAVVSVAAPPAAAEVTQTGSVAPAAPKADRAETKPAAPAPVAKVEPKSAGPQIAALERAPEPDPRKTALDAYVLRDVGDGVALIESRAGRLIEVRPGTALAGGNKVEAIERRGRQWVVVTQKGFIGGERW